MARSKRPRPRARKRLFSIKMKIDRDGMRPTHEDDDNCPICIAERMSGTKDPLAYMPRPDGSPPPIPQAVLLASARKVLADQAPEPGEAIPIIEYGSATPDGSFAMSCFSVDHEGRIFWTSPTEHRLIARLPAMTAN